MRYTAILATTFLFGLVAAAPGAADEPIKLSVLYAGNPDSERMKDFQGFLEKHFAKVTTADFQAFKPDDAKGHDVIIFDWTSIYARDAEGKLAAGGTISELKPPQLGNFDRPAILIGAAGGFVSMEMQLKINWL